MGDFFLIKFDVLLVSLELLEMGNLFNLKDVYSLVVEFECLLEGIKLVLQVVELGFVVFVERVDSGLVVFVGGEEFFNFVLMVLELDFVFVEVDL
jgi:hypothetical protein